MIYFILLIISITLLVITLKPNKCLVSVKEKYSILRNNLPEKFSMLRKPILVSGFSRPISSGTLGYNVNKGDEISVCVDGTSNQAFHILIHELAHSTVKEYSHSEQFWKNFEELKKTCEHLGIYKQINNKDKFCGKYISD